MALQRIEKYVNNLPATLTANTIYYVKNGAGFDMYVTNNSGTIVAYPLNVTPISTTNIYELSANVSSNVVARSNITNWVFNIVAGKTYKIEIVANYQSAALTTGGSMGFILPTGTGTIQGFMEAEIVQTAGATGLKQTIRAINSINTTAGSFMTSTGVGVINSPHNWYSVVILKCTTAGTFQVQWGSEIAASAAQINSNSIMIVTNLN